MSKEPTTKKNSKIVSTNVETDKSTVSESKTAISKSDEKRALKAAKRKAEKRKIEYNTLQGVVDLIDAEYSRIQSACDRQQDRYEKAMSSAKTNAKHMRVIDKHHDELSKMLGAVDVLDRLLVKLEKRQKKVSGDN